jgi:hypothetical protein
MQLSIEEDRRRMAEAWRVPGRLALFVGWRHAVGPVAFGLMLDEAEGIVAACTRCATSSPRYSQRRLFPEVIAFDEKRFNRTRGTGRFSNTWRQAISISQLEPLASGSDHLIDFDRLPERTNVVPARDRNHYGVCRE